MVAAETEEVVVVVDCFQRRMQWKMSGKQRRFDAASASLQVRHWILNLEIVPCPHIYYSYWGLKTMKVTYLALVKLLYTYSFRVTILVYLLLNLRDVLLRVQRGL